MFHQLSHLLFLLCLRDSYKNGQVGGGKPKTEKSTLVLMENFDGDTKDVCYHHLQFAGY